MILRSITKHVRDQNWFAVGIDFIIVVVGVFIGIQVANWNETRQDEATGYAYLSRIQEDLAVDRAVLEERGAFWTATKSYGEAALRYLEEGVLLNDSEWDTVLAFYHATQVWGFLLYDSTYREMISAGNLGLIPDPDLRRTLGDYYSAGFDQKQFVFQMIPDYRDTVRGMTPWAIQNYIWASCVEAPGLDEYRLLDCESPVSAERARQFLDRLQGRAEVVEQLRNRLRNLELMNSWGAQLIDASNELDRRIVDSVTTK